MNGNGTWSMALWTHMVDSFEHEARRRCSYDVRRDEFVVQALIRLTTGMAASLALVEGVRGIEAAYRRYLRRRAWVCDAITN